MSTEFDFDTIPSPSPKRASRPPKSDGLTLRDQFALAALPALLTNVRWDDIQEIKRAANFSYLVANLMMAERSR
jgi:hypothetical protein